MAHQEQGGSPEIVTFGESMLLFMPQGTRGIEYSSAFEKQFGGAEGNLAVGVSRLGHSVGWFGHLGADPAGRFILKQYRGEGVDVSRAKLSADAPTGLMLRETVGGKTSVYYYRKLSAASRMKPEDLDRGYIAGAKILHVTGITMALGESCRKTVFEAVRIARDSGVKISFDPNLRLKLWTLEEAREAVLPLAEQADYFLPGYDEMKLLYDTEDRRAILDRVSRLSGVTVIKSAGETNLLVDGSSVTEIPFAKAENVVDPVGAGDAFCAGFLCGQLKGYSHEESVRLGGLCGALTVQTIGDWEAAPTWEQVEAVMTNRKHVER